MGQGGALVGPEDYPARATSAGREPPTSAATVATVYAEYEAAKRRVGQLDFADLLLITAGAIEEYADVAEEIRSRYRHFVVDEYQDVSPVQQRLLDAWLGGRDDLCVVGDANQTIYSFAGATPEHLLSFTRRFPRLSSCGCTGTTGPRLRWWNWPTGSSPRAGAVVADRGCD